MSDALITPERQLEIIHCANDFSYFCQKYVQIDRNWHTKWIMGESIFYFELIPYQKAIIEHWEAHQYSIGSKFKGGGFTSLASIYGLWKCLFKIDQNVIFYSLTRSDSNRINEVIKKILERLPKWLRGNILKMSNVSMKMFPDTGSKLYLNQPSSLNLQSQVENSTLVIIDDASFIEDLEKKWNLFGLTNNCQVIIQSTPRYLDDWFWERLIDSRVGVGKFVEFKSHYKDMPGFEQIITTSRYNHVPTFQVEMEQKPYEYKEEEPEVLEKISPYRSIYDE